MQTEDFPPVFLVQFQHLSTINHICMHQGTWHLTTVIIRTWLLPKAWYLVLYCSIFSPRFFFFLNSRPFSILPFLKLLILCFQLFPVNACQLCEISSTDLPYCLYSMWILFVNGWLMGAWIRKWFRVPLQTSHARYGLIFPLSHPV